MSRTGRATTAALVAAVLAVSPALAAGGDDGGPAGGGNQAPVVEVPLSGGTGGSTGGNSSGGTTGGGSGSGTGGSAPQFEYRWVEAPGPCAPLPDDPSPVLYAHQVRRLPDGAWQLIGFRCGDAPPGPTAPVIDLDDIRATALTVVARVRPALPTLSVQPPGGALVGQPALFRVGDPGAPPTDSAANALSQSTVTVRLATPTYTWDFGDGSSRSTGGGRGTAYAEGADVPEEGAGDPFVSHTYRGQGSARVTVTASYAVSYSFSGDPRTFTLPAVTVSDSAVLPVKSAQSELVSR